jgi:hypothetical protein
LPELVTDDRPKRQHNGAARKAVLVSGNMLAVHFGCTRQHVEHLAAQGVIERRGDGLVDQDVSRLKYLTQLRSENRRSPRAAADAEHAAAKAALLRLRVAKERRELMPVNEHNNMIDEMCGLILTRLSGFAARCGGRDLAARRAIDQAVYDLRVEISQAASKMAGERGEPDEPA